MFANAAAKTFDNHTLANAYDRIAGSWHRTVSRLRFIDAYGDLIAAAGPALASQRKAAPRVLDAGCGAAGFSLALHKAAPAAEFDLLDLSPKMLEEGRRLLETRGAQVTSICADLGSASLENGRYDMVLCSHLVEHVPNISDALVQLRSALAPGGVALFVVSKPHWCTSLVKMRWRHRAYREIEMVSHLSEAGFTNINSFHFTLGPPSRLSAGYIAYA